MNATEEDQNEGTWTIKFEGGPATWANMQSALKRAIEQTEGELARAMLIRLFEAQGDYEGRMPGLIPRPERPAEGRGTPRWEDGGQTLLVHRDELAELAGSLPPHVEMRVMSILRAVDGLGNVGDLKRPGFMVALKLGDEPTEVSRDDQIHIAEILETRGYDITAPRRAPDGAPLQDPRATEAERTAPDRYREAQEAREAAAGVAQTPEGRKAATYVELGDLKTIARDKGWDLAFEWIVGHQAAEEPELFSDDHEAAQLAVFRRTGDPSSFERRTVRPELDTQDDDDVWRRRENVKRALTDRGVRLHDSVIEAIVEAACDPALRPHSELDATRQRVNREARDRGARRVLNVLWRDFSSELDEVPIGRMMLTCADVVTEVLDHDYDPLIPSP
jgi:hypothetical protein